MSDRRALTTKQAAKRLGCSDRSVRNLAQLGRIDGATRLYPGSPWRVPSEWVARFRPLTASKTSTGY